jgi:chemotaxis protein histidine kinase CheA
MSEHGSVTSKASSARSDGNKPKRPATLVDLVKKLHSKLGHAEALSLTEHLKAAKVLCSIRNHLSNGEMLDSKTMILLLCSGIACHRRWAVGDAGETTASASAKNEADELKMNEEARELVRTSATHIFVLLCMAERQKKQQLVVDASREAVATAGLSSVWAQIAPPPKKEAKKKKGATGQAPAAEEAEEPEDDRREEPSWSVATHLTAGEVARHALVLGVDCLDDEALTAIDGLMGLFYRNAGANMAASMLMPSGNQDFVALSMAKPMAELDKGERTKRLMALAIAAESEAGQSIVRDLLLSFLLPASHAGVRRTLLLTRACSTKAGVDYPELTSRGHEVA